MKGLMSPTPTLVVLEWDGSCLHVPPGIFKSTCRFDHTSHQQFTDMKGIESLPQTLIF